MEEKKAIPNYITNLNCFVEQIKHILCSRCYFKGDTTDLTENSSLAEGKFMLSRRRFVELFVTIEEMTGINFTPNELNYQNIPTIRDLYEFVNAKFQH